MHLSLITFGHTCTYVILYISINLYIEFSKINVHILGHFFQFLDQCCLLQSIVVSILSIRSFFMTSSTVLQPTIQVCLKSSKRNINFQYNSPPSFYNPESLAVCVLTAVVTYENGYFDVNIIQDIQVPLYCKSTLNISGKIWH